LSGIGAWFGAALIVVAAGSAAIAALASAGEIEQTGTFALLGGTPKIVSKFWAVHGNGEATTLKVRQFQLDGVTPILNYDVEMQKTIHMIVVRDDFSLFSHLHPAFNTTTGVFSQPFTKTPHHRYYVFADTEPHGVGQQVFRFTLDPDGAPARPRAVYGTTTPYVAHAGGDYETILDARNLRANRAGAVLLTIVKGDDPADDLGAYLGAAAHIVLIDTRTLAYVHVHAHPRQTGSSVVSTKGGGNMDDMNMTGPITPFLKIALPPLPAGVYAMWIEFRGGNDKLYTTRYNVAVR
jgi:hypothetical protein